MTTFLTDLMKKGYAQDEIFVVTFESGRERKRRRMQAIVIETIAAHRLKKIKEFLACQELATWRRMNGFDRVVESEKSCFHGHRSLPPTPQEYHASLRHELQKLKNAISIPNEKFVRRPVEKRGREKNKLQQKTMDVVDGRRSDSLDELLANFEFAKIKEHVDKRSRKAPQVQVTVTQVDTVQHSSPCPLDPEPSSSTYVNLENTKGEMGPELKELESPSAGTGLKTPGQQCPPNDGIWEQRRTTANGLLTTGVDSSQGGRIPSPTESVDTRASEKSTRITADITFLQQGHKPRSEENKQTPVGKERRPRLGRGCTLLSFSGESWEATCLFYVCPSCFVLCVCFVFLNNCFLSR